MKQQQSVRNSVINRLINTTMMAAILIAPVVDAACNASMTLTKPAAAFVNNGDGTVDDKETGLMWMQCSLGLSAANCATGTATTFTWTAALTAVQTANAGVGTNGHTDWRLPSVAELGSILEAACASPAINTAFFPATQSGSYWTSSPYAISNDSAWRISFSEGAESADVKSATYYVRLVRD